MFSIIHAHTFAGSVKGGKVFRNDQGGGGVNFMAISFLLIITTVLSVFVICSKGDADLFSAPESSTPAAAFEEPWCAGDNY